MKEIVQAKLNQHEYIKKILLASDSRQIVEMNDEDEFWGWGKNHDGRNELGKIWMQLRDGLQKEEI
jgi:predicted NAD-dependent protein-ADP-ribosyltransferase YbiA (DUF1768 family)